MDKDRAFVQILLVIVIAFALSPPLWDMMTQWRVQAGKKKAQDRFQRGRRQGRPDESTDRTRLAIESDDPWVVAGLNSGPRSDEAAEHHFQYLWKTYGSEGPPCNENHLPRR